MDNNINILVMDDDSLLRDLIGIMLENLGYKFKLCQNANETITQYKTNCFNFVILDLVIKDDLGGLETLIELKKINPNIKAIIMTGFDNSPIVRKYREYGFSEYLSKPFGLKELNQKINNIINN